MANTVKNRYNYGSSAEKYREYRRRMQEPLQEVDPKVRKNQEKAQAMSVPYVLFLCVAILAVASSAIMMIRAQESLKENVSRVSRLENEYVTQKAENDAKYDRIVNSVDAAEVKRIATEELGMHYAAQGQMEEAVDLFDTAIAIDKSNYQRIYTAAVTLREYGDDKTGLKYFEELLKDHEAELDDLTRGEALCFLGQYKEAAEILSRVENPGMETVFLLACAKEYTGAHEEALDLLKDYTEEIAFNPEMLNLRGTALCATGEYKEALACFEQALPLSQEGTALQRSIMFNRIAAVENLRDFDRAKELAAQYAEKYPKDERMKRENQFLQTR